MFQRVVFVHSTLHVHRRWLQIYKRPSKASMLITASHVIIQRKPEPSLSIRTSAGKSISYYDIYNRCIVYCEAGHMLDLKHIGSFCVHI